MSKNRSVSKRLNMTTKTIFICILLFVIFGMGAIFMWSWVQQPIDPSNDQPIEIVIEPGSSTTAIAGQLQQEKLIRHPLIFRLVVKQKSLSGQIQAGSFSLDQTMSVPQIAQILSRAVDQQISVTLLEGWRREEVAAQLAADFSEIGISFDEQVFLDLPETAEGYLFPDTYFFSHQANEISVAKTIEANFNQKLTALRPQIQTSPYSLDEILTIASIVEREARVDRPLVAGILIKRLVNDWPLQADATLQYAKGYDAVNKRWWQPPLAIDKELESPYNSYKYQGLPPAPIANPSLSSIQAVLEAQTETDYWFYLTDPQGGMHYAQTYDQHLTNIDRYLR